MRRIDIINGCQNVINAFETSNIKRFVLKVTPDDKVNPEEALKSYNAFMRYYEKFGEIELKILEILELKGVENSKLWAKILTTSRAEYRDEVSQYIRGLHNIGDYLPKFINLLKQDHIKYEEINSQIEVKSVDVEHLEILTLILPETEKESSHPERLIKAIESITLFYKAYAAVLEQNENDISIAAIDSGSDKSFDFLGLAKVMNAVKDLIIELWDRIVFYKERKFSQQLDVIAKSLPIMENIQALEEKFGKEKCGILNKYVTDGVKSFINVGAIIPELDNHSTFEPRQLMAPEPKLLTMPEKIVYSETHQSQDESTNKNVNKQNSSTNKETFTAEQIKLLKSLLTNHEANKEQLDDQKNEDDKKPVVKKAALRKSRGKKEEGS